MSDLSADRPEWDWSSEDIDRLVLVEDDIMDMAGRKRKRVGRVERRSDGKEHVICMPDEEVVRIMKYQKDLEHLRCLAVMCEREDDVLAVHTMAMEKTLQDLEQDNSDLEKGNGVKAMEHLFDLNSKVKRFAATTKKNEFRYKAMEMIADYCEKQSFSNGMFESEFQNMGKRLRDQKTLEQKGDAVSVSVSVTTSAVSSNGYDGSKGVDKEGRSEEGSNRVDALCRDAEENSPRTVEQKSTSEDDAQGMLFCSREDAAAALASTKASVSEIEVGAAASNSSLLGGKEKAAVADLPANSGDVASASLSNETVRKSPADAISLLPSAPL
ncbi:uncharacterized protein [Oscarella lobularis]|uniref:uncharacterized protein isoform X2 n=1 Tax=Oscarella lobularis TaxID=121494 RepID=UPI003313EA9F